ncbi:unnamed protein product [Closterium sp. NIES-64]|nr:unnamed protein product [Closterium sp. NIES-64]
MCFWPDSDAHRPQRAFGFRVLRTLPPAAETLEMRAQLSLESIYANPSPPYARATPCPFPMLIPICPPLLSPFHPPVSPSVPFPPSPPSHAHHPPRSMLAGTFFLMERSNRRAPSSPDWESFGVVKSLGARSARVDVLPHLLPWLSASAAASLRHGSCATLLDYHSTQTNILSRLPHLVSCLTVPVFFALLVPCHFATFNILFSITRPLTCPPLLCVPLHPTPCIPRHASLAMHRSACQLPVLSAWEFYLCKPLPLCRRSTLLQAPSPSSRLQPLTLVYVPDSKLPSPHRPPAALATAPALAPSTPPSPSGSAVVPLSPTAALVALDITPVCASPRRLPSRLNPSKPVEISLIRDIISFVSQRASTNAAKEGLLNASVQELADTDAPGLSDEDVKELNCMLKTWGVDADAKQLDTVVDEYGRIALHVAARDGDVLVVQALLGLGMPVSVRCNNRSTPMHRAAWGEHVACMKFCFLPIIPSHPPSPHHSFLPPTVALPAPPIALPPCATPTGTPLHDAVRQGKWEAVKWLAQQGIDPQEVETNPFPGVLPDDLLAVEVAVVQAAGEVEVVGVVMGVEAVEVVVGAAEALGVVEGVAAAVGEEGAVVVVVLPPCATPTGTPLHDAARQGKWEAVEWLAQQGIDPQEVATNPSPGVLPDDLLAKAVQIW